MIRFAHLNRKPSQPAPSGRARGPKASGAKCRNTTSHQLMKVEQRKHVAVGSIRWANGQKDNEARSPSPAIGPTAQNQPPTRPRKGPGPMQPRPNGRGCSGCGPGRRATGPKGTPGGRPKHSQRAPRELPRCPGRPTKTAMGSRRNSASLPNSCVGCTT